MKITKITWIYKVKVTKVQTNKMIEWNKLTD